ncbi:MAG: SDR family NAD(P)-dependent oxidoreductase [Ketobacteraceae bacterium]|nr:SDR family NAD(P)-dependent oxidoreductase [Ketobacteraceae bacterium]
MTTLSRTLTVDRPVEEAFNYLADFSSTEQWDVNVLRAEKLTPGAPRPGTEFSIIAKAGPGKTPMEYCILDLKPNLMIRLKGKARNFTLTDTITLEALSEARTRIDYTVDVEMGGLTGKLTDTFPGLLEPMTDRAVNGLVRALNDRKEPISEPSELADKLVLPGMMKFTRLGYLRAKKHWKGLSANLTGKKAVITGASSGLGRETAIALAKMGAEILVVARNPDKVKDLSEEITAETGRPIHSVIADLSLIEETARAASDISGKFPVIDILVNNAGALFNDRQVTPEQFEKSFALLLLSPFVLTETLLPNLEKSAQGRVINVSSGGMYTQPVYLDDLQYEEGTYDGPKAYARAKRGLVDMTEFWTRQHRNSHVTFNAMHPGWADTPAVASSMPGFYKVTRPLLRTPREGADTIIWLAAAREVEDHSGKFWLDREPHTTVIFPGTGSSEAKQAKLHSQLTELAQQIATPGS